jgi:hypothetical protein
MCIYLFQVVTCQKTVWIERVRVNKDFFIVHDGPWSADREYQTALSLIGQNDFTKYLGLSWILLEESSLCTRRRQPDSAERLSSCQWVLPILTYKCPSRNLHRGTKVQNLRVSLINALRYGTFSSSLNSGSLDS